MTTERDDTKTTDRPPTNYRRRRAQDQRNLFLIVVAFLLIAGTGLIYIIYGTAAAAIGLACLLVGVGVLGLLWFILTLIEGWVER
jgi:hypothetical protein